MDELIICTECNKILAGIEYSGFGSSIGDIAKSILCSHCAGERLKQLLGRDTNE